MLFQDQINVINNKRESGKEREDGEIDYVSYRYIGDKYKDFINNILTKD